MNRQPAWWRRAVVVDLALALATAATAVVGVHAELGLAARPVPPAAGGYAVAVAVGAVLLVRRRRPLLCAVAAALLLATYHLAGYPGYAPGVALFPLCYSLAVHGARRWGVAAAMAAALLGYLPALPPHPVWPGGPDLYGPTGALITLTVLGATVRQRRLDADERVRQAAVVAHAEGAQRMAEERLRIAQELHDVMAHTIAVIAVQGGLALDAFDDDPEQARQAVVRIRAAGRQALAELRAALAPLRGQADGGQGPARPQPGLRDLPELAARVREAGLDVVLDLPAGPGAGELPPLVQLTAYRIVQEALTNTIRHSTATAVRVELRVEAGVEAALTVRVAESGGAGPAGAGGPVGFGLIGMRERAEALGGSVSAGPVAGAGWQVRSRLPLQG